MYSQTAPQDTPNAALGSPLAPPPQSETGAVHVEDVLAPATPVCWAELQPTGLYAERLRPLLGGLLTLLVLPPIAALMIVVGLTVLLAQRNPRRIFFIQTRMGHRGKAFQLVKFRTMNDVPLADFISWGHGDRQRVTRLGRVLRSMHLDELPQILNVLRGEMSLIGPRPEMLEIEEWAEQHVPGFQLRLAIKPGITGLAQITQGYTGHDIAAYEQKLRINLKYLNSLSLGGDLSILVRTVVWMVKGKGWAWRSQARRASGGDEPSPS